MLSSLRSGLGTAVALIAMLVVEAIGLSTGTGGLILIGMVAVVTLVTVAFRLDLRRIGVGTACAAAFILTWNGVQVGSLRAGDLVVLAALTCFVVADPEATQVRLPWWIKQLLAALVLLVAIQLFFPPDIAYLAHRTVVGAGGRLSDFSKVPNLTATNLFVGFKFIVAVAAIPWAFVGAARVDRRAVGWLAISFALGAGLSGGVAFLDYLGGNIGAVLTGVANVRDRQAGFSDHPNFLAAGLVLAIPIAFWMLLSQRRNERIMGAAAMIGCIAGVLASGSRGGAVCAVIGLALSVVAHERTRGYAPGSAIGAVVTVGILGGIVPSIGALLLRVTRLDTPATTIGSDLVRAVVGAQGLRDFHHSPYYGIGLQVSFDASQVYLQELASGGLLLFVAMQLYMLGAMGTALRQVRRNPLAAALLVSLVATVALNFAEADLTDRFYYVPAAILVALMSGSQAEAADDGSSRHAETTEVARR